MTKKLSPSASAKPAPSQYSAADKAKLATLPSLNAAAVIEAYSGNVVGKDVDIQELISTLKDSFKASKEGDLGGLERMLIGQATALQSIFTSLARRAQLQEFQKNYESFLTLALKAQAQSRTTIQAVIELKYPKQVAFVKQANISNGPQQVNNGNTTSEERVAGGPRRAEEKESQQNKLLVEESYGSAYVDTPAAPTTGGSYKTMEAVASVHGADKHRRQGRVGTKC